MDMISLDFLVDRVKYNRPIDSYPDNTTFVHESAVQIDGFQLYRSPTSEQTWLIREGDLKKRGFVARNKQEIMNEVGIWIDARIKKEREGK